MATIEQVDARLKEISDTFNAAQKQIQDLNLEFNQLLGYKQALVDAQANAETPQKEEADPAKAPGLLEG